MNKYLDVPQTIYKLTDKNSRWLELEANEKFAKICSKAIIIIELKTEE